jgi:hypothetical protein
MPFVLGRGTDRRIGLGWGHWPRVFENGVLRKIFGHKRDEVTGDWKKLHNEAIYDLCSPIIRVVKSERNGISGTYRG